MPITSEDVPEAPGPSGSMQFGEATESARLQREVASRTGGGNNSPPVPQGAPAAPLPPSAPPVQSAPSQDAGMRLDMNQVFPPMPELQQQFPWRDALRAAAYHPQAGPGLARLADQIQGQHGPNGRPA